MDVAVGASPGPLAEPCAKLAQGLQAAFGKAEVAGNPIEMGDPSGWAWTEAGALDKRGHTEGWKLARSVVGIGSIP